MKMFQKLLDELIAFSKISEVEYQHFMKRGIQYEKFDKRNPHLQEIFPNGIPIGASEKFIQGLEIPYQETSYVCSPTTNSPPKQYLYKKFSEKGGIKDLLAGKRPVGDNIFASLNRILLGNRAILVSADNLIENKEQIWDWKFFGNNLKASYPDIYEDLERVYKKKMHSEVLQVVIARKKDTFQRLNIVEKSKNKEIAVLNDQNIKVIFLTNKEGLEIASKIYSKNVDCISASDEKGNINIKECLVELRKKYKVSRMLNDGGRIMSDGLRDKKLLGGERVSYEPFPGKKHLPEEIKKEMILGKEGFGIDGSEIKDAFVAFSKELNIEREETFKLHLYSMV